MVCNNRYVNSMKLKQFTILLNLTQRFIDPNNNFIWKHNFTEYFIIIIIKDYYINIIDSLIRTYLKKNTYMVIT